MVFAAMDDLSADELNLAVLAGQVIARGRRATSSTAAAAEQGVLRVDDVALTFGRLYWIGTNTLQADTSVANDVARVNLRCDTTGADATTSSTVFALNQIRLADAAVSEAVSVSDFYTPAAPGEVLSVLLTTSRTSGTGNISLISNSTIPINLYVIDCGVDPGDTGVDI